MINIKNEWIKAQEWEKNWHDNCVNSYWEETKQIVYARKMGLVLESVDGKYPVIDLKEKSVCDIGAGAYSLLLKTIHGSRLTAIDPCDYPEWTYERYKANNITFLKQQGEDPILEVFDEVWIYNCLQHTQNPQKIINNARSVSKIIRIFEWVENGISIGHPHNLTESELNVWLGGEGRVENLNENGCHGLAYYGIFKGNLYV